MIVQSTSLASCLSDRFYTSLTSLSDVDQRSQSSQEAAESPPSHVQDQTVERQPPGCRLIQENEQLSLQREGTTDSQDMESAQTQHTSLFYSIRGKEYHLNRDLAPNFLQNLADHLDAEYAAARLSWRRADGDDKYLAEMRLRFLDALYDDFDRVAEESGARRD